MTYVEPAAGRARVEEMPSGLRIVIPSRRLLWLRIFLAAWLVGWAVGWRSAAGDIASGDHSLFMLAWIVGWTIGGAVAIVGELWLWFGREVVVAAPDVLEVRQAIGPFGRTRRFKAAEIRDLRTESLPLRESATTFTSSWGMGGGTLVFDYGARTFRFGQIDEAEAKGIVARIATQLGLGARAPRFGETPEA